MIDFHERVDALSPKKRGLLTLRLRQQANTTVREDARSNKRLVAYIVSNQKPTFKVGDLRSFLQEKLPEYMVPSAFVQLKALPRLPNGKVDLKALPAPETVRSELSGNFVAPRTTVEKILASIWTQVLRVEQVGIHDNFFELGGDSILIIQIVAKAKQAGLRFTPKQLFDNQTIAKLAAVVSTTQTIQAEQDLVTGEVPLTPIQHWFFAQNQPDPYHWNQSFLLEMRQICDRDLLEQVIQHLIEHHDALRLRFIQNESGWQQINTALNQITAITRVDLSALPEIEQKFALEATAAKLQASLDLSKGPLMRVALFDLVPQKVSRLLIIIHHLAVDGVSWRILLEDLQTAYQQISQGEVIHLPNKTTSFKQWAQYLQEYAQSTKLMQERDYWLTEPRKPLSGLPTDYSEADNTVATADTVSVSLSHKETQALLQEVHKAYNTHINDVLLTALVQAFAEWTRERTLLVDLEGHGREEIFKDVDLSRTVGWFTTHFPVLLDIEEASDPGNALKVVKEQLRGIPNRGIGYDVLRYLTKDRETASKLQSQPQAEVIFNYLGQTDQIFSESLLFTPAQESSGSAHSLRGSRVYLLEVTAIVVVGQLQVNWTYSKAIHRQTTVERLAESFIKALLSLIDHCQSSEVKNYTPSDFALAQVSQKELDAAFALVEFEGR